jgi:hypothetical protein
MVARVNVPVSVRAWDHDKVFTLPRTANPQRQPKIVAVSDSYCVPIFSWDWLKFHQPHFGGGQTTLHCIFE